MKPVELAIRREKPVALPKAIPQEFRASEIGTVQRSAHLASGLLARDSAGDHRRDNALRRLVEHQVLGDPALPFTVDLRLDLTVRRWHLYSLLFHRHSGCLGLCDV